MAEVWKIFGIPFAKKREKKKRQLRSQHNE